ncbi:MAG: hypothetical protein JNK48_04370 [Bryobacterales bacterium]|nr:hypothetical protein [Bryobacterales bacterium]
MRMAIVLAWLWQTAEVTTPEGRKFFHLPDEGNLAAQAEALRGKDGATAEELLAAGKIYDDLWWFSRSIAVYSEGMRRFAGDFRFPRFRGHRYFSTRQFAKGVEDLEKARELAPASFDVSYHLGLGYYLMGEFGKAAEAYGRCLEMTGKTGPAAPGGARSCTELHTAENSRVAISEWMYRSLRRAGKHGEAAALLGGIGEGMKVTTNESYYLSLLFYKGRRKEEAIVPGAKAEKGNTFSTVGYGVANFHLLEGRKARGCEMLRKIVNERAWNAFGFIAAEADLARGVCGGN